MALHSDEITVDESLVRSLLAHQCPQWADLPLSAVGGGTDNTMYRLGDSLLVRVPRSPSKAASIAKERTWLPRLAPHLPLPIPVGVFDGVASEIFELPWSVLQWIEGEEVAADTIEDWARFGTDLAGFVRALHRIDLMGARREGSLSWYRGGPLHVMSDDVDAALATCHELVGFDVDTGVLAQVWAQALEIPDASGPQVWMHSDLRPANLLARDGALHAVIDFGGLALGVPTAEHATIWDYPAAARESYRRVLAVDEPTWLKARGWALGVGVMGASYYWETFPAFVAECMNRLRNIAESAS